MIDIDQNKVVAIKWNLELKHSGKTFLVVLSYGA